MSVKYTIKKIISLIKTELNDYYPLQEINSFVFLLFNHYFGYTKVEIQLKQDEEVNDNLATQIIEDVEELKINKPIQYILEKTEFYSLPFIVGQGVLIPRPETEELVDWIIAENNNQNQTIADIGTGSGCIAISLAKNLNQSVVYAYDNSPEALSITRRNSTLNHVKVHSKFFDILHKDNAPDKTFDIIVSNPPYVTEREKQHMQSNVLDYEPGSALFVPDNNPLLYYKAITDFALQHLKKGGKLYLEINENLGKETAMLLEEKKFQNIALKKDINEKDRMLRGILK
jgi:release factor glutamine methyltransferase